MKLIFVSNRLPYHIHQNSSGEYETKLSVSGLVTGVQSIFKTHEGVWIGWNGETSENVARREDIKPLVDSWKLDGYYAVDISNDLLVLAHENFNNRSLWSLFQPLVRSSRPVSCIPFNILSGLNI